jgi:hypothetical protein
LTPLALDDTSDLIFGRIDFITTLNVQALEKRLADKGISAEVTRGADVPNGFLRAERGSAGLTVPALVREQVQVELMTLETLTSTIDWFLDAVERRGAGEAQVDLFYEGRGLCVGGFSMTCRAVWCLRTPADPLMRRWRPRRHRRPARGRRRAARDLVDDGGTLLVRQVATLQHLGRCREEARYRTTDDYTVSCLGCCLTAVASVHA